MIDNLLTISRADSGHTQRHRTAVPVMALAREAAGSLAYRNATHSTQRRLL